MTDPDHELEKALASLRPRSPGPAVTARLARELDVEPARRGVAIAWSAGLSALAAAFVAAFAFLGDFAETEAPAYQLVHVEQTRPDVQFFRPVRLSDGSFARPVRVRWQDTTRWEDPQGDARLINYRPNDQLALLPLETN
jgi:hypothetical protein